MRFYLSVLTRSIIKSVLIIIFSILVVFFLGFMLTSINNSETIENLLENNKPSLPSVLLDRNGKVITQFYSDEKRSMVSLDAVPDHLVKALILWEDESFYHHHGFNPLAIMRAAFNNFMGRPVSGASTLTQQLSRTLFLNNEFSIKRKIRELLIAFQLEKKFTKNEILTLYLNNVPFGYGINGVQAASRFFFDKDVSEINYSEASSLVTVISNPTFYSFIRFPQNHRTKQRQVLNKMARSGVISQNEADTSFNEFWVNYQTSRTSVQGAFFSREDKAPFFSNWVLQIVEKELPSVNIFRDGLTIRTTLDLDSNQYVEEQMREALDRQQRIFEAEQNRNFNIVQNFYIDAISLMSQTFSLTNINIGQEAILNRGRTYYQNDINPALNLAAKVFGVTLVDAATENAFSLTEGIQNRHEDVQGAFLAVDNETGQILTMIGGKHFDSNNRFNYAMQGRRQTGSAYKPFVYSAALDTGMFNPATIIIDEPTNFTMGSEDPSEWYRPYNYGAVYYGRVSVRRALRRSLNIPAVKIFYEIGKNNNYKVPNDRAALLLGINAQREIDSRLPKEISTVLGTASASLAEMTSAYSVFANGGQRRIPSSVLQVEDRDGKVIWNPGQEMERFHRDNRRRLQIISPQNAYVMTDILKGTVHLPDGFLFGTRRRIIAEGKPFPDIELAAKSGTTQNWSDGWILGYSPEITAGAWMGFRQYGLSLGFNQDGSIILGNIWVDYMRYAHLGKDKVVFKEPPGIVRVKVCRESGLLPSADCEESSLYFDTFLQGHTPQGTCNICNKKTEQRRTGLQSFTSDMLLFEFDDHNTSSSVNIDKSLFLDDPVDLFDDTEADNYYLNENTETFMERPTDYIKPEIKDSLQKKEDDSIIADEKNYEGEVITGTVTDNDYHEDE